MCGIAALFSLSSELLKYIFPMTDIISYRGPDDDGFAFFEKDTLEPALFTGSSTPDNISQKKFYGSVPENSLIGLGHRRLSILDLSAAGHQPMCSADGRYWIVFNGEIYNYKELREELISYGYSFNSLTDTEVIMAAYDKWGKDCLNKFNGMWAFILIDRKGQKAFIARDRFGVKPLYFWFSPSGMLAFSSEIKQFSVLPGWEARINGQRAHDFLRWSILDHTSETLFKDVFQLRGGEAVELSLPKINEIINTKKLPVYRWYQLKPAPFSGSFSDAAEQFRNIFKDSIRLRLRADVPIGSCLSGGLDSSSIVCMVNDLLKEQNSHELQKTFSACFDSKKYDEKRFIDEVISTRQIQSFKTFPDMAELMKISDKITWHQDEPFGSTSIFAQWCVFKLSAENNVKVMLDGQGADEQLAGYFNFFPPYFYSLLMNLKLLTFFEEIEHTKKLHGYGFKQMLKGMAQISLPESLLQISRKYLADTPPVTNWLDLKRINAADLNPVQQSGYSLNNIPNTSFAQLTGINLPMLLHWEDRNSMAHSIESRIPFLDYRLVEFVLGLPDDFKIKHGMTKAVLRDGMQGIIPDMIKNRVDKIGFATPEEEWFKTSGHKHFRKLLEEAVTVSDGIILPDSLKDFDDIINGKRAFSPLPWRLINFGAWMKSFNIKN
jgi:asparagine synthase (glutamine-hydrolysing)